MSRHEAIWQTPAAVIGRLLEAAEQRTTGERTDDDADREAYELFLKRYEAMKHGQ